MGSGLYSTSDRVTRATTKGYYTDSIDKIFNAKSVNNAMNPNRVKIRESRDSKEHPNSVAIILALDVTGSMGSIPHHLIKDGLPTIMDSIIKSNIKDPQLLFLGIGDHECDNAPLQVGQFESSDELLDKWLTSIYLEGGGGGNLGESYLLAWYFAAKHTAIDCLEKRNQKGFLFTIGDEPVLKSISQRNLKEIMGDGQYENNTAMKLLDEARKMYNVYHIHVMEGSNGHDQSVIDSWKQILGKNLILAEKHQEISDIITSIVTAKPLKVKDESKDDKKEEIIL